MLLMRAQAAQDLHILKLWLPAPQFRQAAFLGHMGGVWLRGSEMLGPTCRDLTIYCGPEGTVEPNGLHHRGNRPHHPSKRLFYL